ncbi:MAG: endolytic transglycosylase MltG [Pyrinomonadaceae bacterium]
MTRVLTIIFALLAVVVAAICFASYSVYSSVTTPHQHDKANQFIKIEKGSTPPQIIAKLAAEGVISSETSAGLYLRTLADASKLQAGEYQFPSPISTVQVLKLLEKGQDLTIRLTIPEGFTRFDIAKRVAEKFSNLPPAAEGSIPAPPADERSILALMDDVTLIRDISPTARNLEGYMYPTTYNVSRDATPKEIITMMVEQFRKFWKPEWSDQARSLGRTPHEIVTIASLIETETGVEAERPIVAGIINNRLSRNIPLGIDQTNVYIAKMMGRWDGTIHKSDLEVDSPYNTRIKTGIPPGPISSVTESSIRAALNPNPNNYIFYVRNVDLNDGSHWFYASAAEFEKGKAKYQQWLERERQEKRSNESGTN